MMRVAHRWLEWWRRLYPLARNSPPFRMEAKTHATLLRLSGLSLLAETARRALQTTVVRTREPGTGMYTPLVCLVRCPLPCWTTTAHGDLSRNDVDTSLERGLAPHENNSPRQLDTDKTRCHHLPAPHTAPVALRPAALAQCCLPDVDMLRRDIPALNRPFDHNSPLILDTDDGRARWKTGASWPCAHSDSTLALIDDAARSLARPGGPFANARKQRQQVPLRPTRKTALVSSTSKKYAAATYQYPRQSDAARRTAICCVATYTLVEITEVGRQYRVKILRVRRCNEPSV